MEGTWVRVQRGLGKKHQDSLGFRHCLQSASVTFRGNLGLYKSLLSISKLSAHWVCKSLSQGALEWDKKCWSMTPSRRDKPWWVLVWWGQHQLRPFIHCTALPGPQPGPSGDALCSRAGGKWTCSSQAGTGQSFIWVLRAPKPSEVQGLTRAQCCLTKRRSQPGLIGPTGSIMLSLEPGLRGTGVSPGGLGVRKGVISAPILLLNNKWLGHSILELRTDLTFSLYYI